MAKIEVLLFCAQGVSGIHTRGLLPVPEARSHRIKEFSLRDRASKLT